MESSNTKRCTKNLNAKFIVFPNCHNHYCIPEGNNHIRSITEKKMALRGAENDSSHYLVVAKVREILQQESKPVSKS
jgi:hypothetical protein